MSITVNTNLSSMIAQRSLYKATNKMNTALQRLSTGARINSSKDDASGSAISTKLGYKISSYDVAKDNAQMGQSMLETANGSLSQINSMLQRIRDLSEQASNGTYGMDERKAMQAEIDGLTEEIYRIKNTTEFNGKKILGEEEYTGSISTVPDLMISEISNINNLRNTGKIIGISNEKELQKLSELSQAGETFDGISLTLTRNIDLSKLEDIDGNGSNWGAIKDFKGTLDGNGYSIKNMVINQHDTDNQGFFSNLNGATIKNLNIQNAKVSGKYNVGIISGSMSNSNIDNCSTSGNVEANYNDKNQSFAGGFIGRIFQNSIINNCSSKANIKGTGNYVGGFVGETRENVTYTNCSSSGNVEGFQHVGGFSGQIFNTVTMGNCKSYANVTGDGIGGFVGAIGFDPNKNGKNIIDNCFCNGNLYVINIDENKDNYNGGFFRSYYTYDVNQNNQITNCKTTSKFIKKGKFEVGAFMGHLSPTSNINMSNNEYDETINEGVSSIAGTTTTIDESKIKSNIGLKVPELKTEKEYEVKSCNLQVGIGSDKNSTINVETSFELDDFKISVANDSIARSSLKMIDEMMDKVTAKMTEIGATQNRLESTMEFQDVQISALTSANSLIKDADIAEESSNYIKNQILQNVTSSLLATANQNPSIALQLL